MYKMCKTEKSASRQRLIEQTLLELMKREPYDAITITSLCSELKMPRKAFYRYFDSKETALRANRSQELESASIPMRSRAKLSSSVDGDIDEIGCGLGLCTVETAVLPPVEPMPSVSVEEANALMSDSEAKRLQSTDYFDTEIYTGAKRAEINVDTISHMFSAGDVITLNSLKEKKLVPKNVGYIKILARGRIDKPLTVVAQDFSVAAAKMIILTGGRAIPTHASEERMPRPRRKISEEF
jgi:AcrR family transcriptional regulator